MQGYLMHKKFRQQKLDEKQNNKRVIDWLAIGKDYCSGASVTSLSVKYKVSRPAIDKQIEKNQWKQDVSAVIAKQVAAKVAGVKSNMTPEAKQEAIEAESNRQTDIALEHRTKISELSKVGYEALYLVRASIRQLKKQFDDEGKLSNTELQKVVSTFKSLNEAIVATQTREAAANGIDLLPKQNNENIVSDESFANIIKMAAANKARGD
jgi:hypothetical protein